MNVSKKTREMVSVRMTDKDVYAALAAAMSKAAGVRIEPGQVILRRGDDGEHEAQADVVRETVTPTRAAPKSKRAPAIPPA